MKILPLVAVVCLGGNAAGAELASTQNAAVTFSKDVAPIVYRRCATCHHTGGTAPFDLTTYTAARQRAGQIATVTASRYMPPWKPEPGDGEFLGEQRLDAAEIQVLQRWAATGAEEGDRADLPTPPVFTGGWQLGKPDAVVPMPAYTLPAEGTDVFRIFVVPLPVTTRHYVRGLEFRAGASNVIHHASIRIDRTPASRTFDEADPSPGYDGLIARSATYPDGHFLAWTPGQVAPLLPKGLAWTLEPGTDLVVELHFQPTGKPELVQPSIGLFFGSDPPERTPAMLRLGRQSIDIAPGNTRYMISDAFVLPVDVELLAVQPHAHYRARETKGTATLPDGTTKSLIEIKDWDFRWQQVYRYKAPIALPKGTRLSMEYRYDNSIENPRNIQQPPQRVGWGQRSADEMGDLWLQVLPKNERDLDILVDAFRPKQIAEDIIGTEARIRVEPSSVELHDDAGMLYLQVGRVTDAVAQFGTSAALRPGSAATHFNYATALTLAGRREDAMTQYLTALAIRPEYALAHNNLGGVLVQAGHLEEALAHFREAVRVDPAYAEAFDNLGRVLLQRREWGDGVDALERAVRLKPAWPTALGDLAWALATAPDADDRDADRALINAERAVGLTGRQDPRLLDVLAAAQAAGGHFARAVETADAALALSPESAAAVRMRRDLYKRGLPYITPQR